ncbi:tRNA (cytosine(34)-C(5))-methyltransferase, mitochondrial isoform 2-T2 [Syngnathus typhle]
MEQMFAFSAYLRKTLNDTSGKLTPRLLCSLLDHDAVLKHKKPKRASLQVSRTSKKERSSCQLILDYFDHQYHKELGESWTSARSVLLDPSSWQYGVLLNRFTVVTDVKRVLLSKGFSALLPQKEALTASVFGAECQTSKGSPSKRPSENSHLDDSSPAAIQRPQRDGALGPPSSWLQCYLHPRPLRFPSQAHRAGQLKQYYLLNAASVLPVLALQVRDGEKVLDLCAAPGGKAFAIMQCATPAFLCCNEPDGHRRDRLMKTLESFLPRSLSGRVVFSDRDGRSFGQSQAGTYDKVLVDAPCSNDRSWLFSSAGQQVEQRLKERGRLPQLQLQLLRRVTRLHCQRCVRGARWSIQHAPCPAPRILPWSRPCSETAPKPNPRTSGRRLRFLYRTTSHLAPLAAGRDPTPSHVAAARPRTTANWASSSCPSLVKLGGPCFWLG